jgi:hypothetical protein
VTTEEVRDEERGGSWRIGTWRGGYTRWAAAKLVVLGPGVLFQHAQLERCRKRRRGFSSERHAVLAELTDPSPGLYENGNLVSRQGGG